MEKDRTPERTHEWFEKKWGIESMVPNRALIRKRLVRRVLIDILLYSLMLAFALAYGLYTGIIYLVFPFFIAFFIAFGVVIALVSFYTGLDPFAVLKRKMKRFKRDMGKK